MRELTYLGKTDEKYLSRLVLTAIFEIFEFHSSRQHHTEQEQDSSLVLSVGSHVSRSGSLYHHPTREIC